MSTTDDTQDDDTTSLGKRKHEVVDSPSNSREIGSLTQPGPQESRYIGSSSGVYFINTVKQAFEISADGAKAGVPFPAAEETVGGEDDLLLSACSSPEKEQEYRINVGSSRAVSATRTIELGPLLPHDVAQTFVIEYFKIWHPVLPFLSGPVFLQELEALYQSPDLSLKTTTGSITQLPINRKHLCFLIITQCVVGMGVYCSPSSSAADFRALPSGVDIASLATSLASRNDILTIQTILAAQLYCASTLALRTASTLSGVLNRLLTQTGLHRCPNRYKLDDETRDMRKRIFWSWYALDRYLCQALGLPIGLPDSDIDVCISGRRELHRLDQQYGSVIKRHESSLSAAHESEHESPTTSGSALQPTPDRRTHREQPIDEAPGDPAAERVALLANLVDYGKLLGQAIEMFHKSIHTRQTTPRKILYLRAEVDKWYNSLPDDSGGADTQNARFMPFFHVLYEQLVITIHRPALSLSRSSPEFHHGLQTTIQAARRTIVALEREQALFWPGYIASVWMSGLILSFACQVGMYSITKGSQEVARCLSLLQKMSIRCRSAQHCFNTLAALLDGLQQSKQPSITTSNSTERGARKWHRFDLDSRDQSAAVSPPVLTSQNNTPSSDGVAQAAHGHASNAFDPMPATDAQWNVNDWFHDLSWDNLFGVDSVMMLDTTNTQDFPI